jgi:hypothetical protein
MCKNKVWTILIRVFLLTMVLSVAFPAGEVFAQAGAGDITIYIKDLQGNDIPVGPDVKAEIWGVSQPKGGGSYTWHYIYKDAVDVGGVATVTWTQAEIDAEIDLTANNFWFVLTAWGGDPAANTQVETESSGLWWQFMLYDPTLPAYSVEVRTITEGGFPGYAFSYFPSPQGVFYHLDLTGVSYVDFWAAVNITYKDCPHDYQPTIKPDKKASMESEGYSFSFNAADELLTITNAATGFYEVYSAREDGNGGYILELEYLGDGTVSYDALNQLLYVTIDYDAMGLSNGDTFFVLPEFQMDLADPNYGSYSDVTAYASFGYVTHALNPNVVQTHTYLLTTIWK